MNVNNVFEVTTVDMKEVFANNQEKCFYIPAYQRPYSWGTDEIQRTWEDIVYGLGQLDHSDDYITFLGSIITLHDIKHESISPIVRGEVPSKVMVVVDGQQRLTTMLLLIISLDNAIRQRLTKDRERVLGKVLDILAIASKVYKSPKSYGLDDSKNYPKIIRAYDDQWATNNEDKYTSPIASFLHQYINFIEDKGNKRKKFNYSVSDTTTYAESYKKIQSNANHFGKLIKSFLSNRSLHEIMIKKSTLLGIEEELVQEIGIHVNQDDSNKDIYVLLLVLRFVLQRVFVADIVAKKEEYAFEMFDSLNTTGDPLTAFETFKPKVIEYIKLENYLDSTSKKNIDTIEVYLNFEPKKRNPVTETLITAFALSETGKTLSKKLRDQRIYLRDQYKVSKDKEGFVENMSNVSSVYHIWNQSNGGNLHTTWGKVANNELIDNVLNDDIALTCLQFLSKVRHVVALPLLSRFSEKKPDEFVGAIKAITAFFVLWRSARSTTSGIDNCYRKLMKQGVVNPRARGADGVDIPQGEIFAFNRAKDSEISLQKLQVAFKYFLYKEAADHIEIYSKDTWVKRLKSIEIYNVNKEVCKFLLITAFDSVVSIQGSRGLVERAKEGVASTLNRTFYYSLFESIEHISPDKNGWEGVSDERKHTLGNLTLLPQINNSSISNKPLEEKELIFKALCAETQDKQDNILRGSKISFNSNTKQILAESQHFPYLKSLSELSGWNDQVIESRTENLGGLIWDTLAVDWLEFDN